MKDRKKVRTPIAPKKPSKNALMIADIDTIRVKCYVYSNEDKNDTDYY